MYFLSEVTKATTRANNHMFGGNSEANKCMRYPSLVREEIATYMESKEEALAVGATAKYFTDIEV